MSTILACVAAGPIYLAPLECQDIDSIAQLGKHPEVFQYIPEIEQPFDAKAWCQKILSNPENYIRHVVKVGPTRLPVGYVQINRRRNCDLELGYWLGKEYWGKGIASVAALNALALFVSAGGSSRVFAAAKPENVASRRVLAKLGFQETTESTSSIGMIDHIWSPRETKL